MVMALWYVAGANLRNAIIYIAKEKILINHNHHNDLPAGRQVCGLFSPLI
jgi:hypothetical protein